MLTICVQIWAVYDSVRYTMYMEEMNLRFTFRSNIVLLVYRGGYLIVASQAEIDYGDGSRKSRKLA